MVDFAEVETKFPINHKILRKSRGFRFFLAKTRCSVEKREDESGAWQRRVKLLITQIHEGALRFFTMTLTALTMIYFPKLGNAG